MEIARTLEVMREWTGDLETCLRAFPSDLPEQEVEFPSVADEIGPDPGGGVGPGKEPIGTCVPSRPRPGRGRIRWADIPAALSWLAHWQHALASRLQARPPLFPGAEPWGTCSPPRPWPVSPEVPAAELARTFYTMAEWLGDIKVCVEAFPSEVPRREIRFRQLATLPQPMMGGGSGNDPIGTCAPKRPRSEEGITVWADIPAALSWLQLWHRDLGDLLRGREPSHPALEPLGTCAPVRPRP